MTGDSGKPARKPGRLDVLDARLEELRAEFPGWDLWYVPAAVGSTTWCAKPKPLLNCGTPDQLRAAVRRADQRRLADLAGQAAASDDGGEDADAAPPGVTELPRRRRPDGPP